MFVCFLLFFYKKKHKEVIIFNLNGRKEEGKKTREIKNKKLNRTHDYYIYIGGKKKRLSCKKKWKKKWREKKRLCATEKKCGLKKIENSAQRYRAKQQ